MSLQNKVISSARWSAIGIWGRRLIGFAVFAVITRHVSPESLGLVALAAVYIGLVEMLSKQGLGMALVQRKELKEEHLNTAFYINLGTALLLSLLSIVFAHPLANLLGDERLTSIIRALAITFPINATNVAPVALQSRNFDFKSQAVQSFSATVISGLVSIPMAILGYEVWALVAQTVTFSIVNCIVIWIRTPWRPALNFNREEARSLTSFSAKILLSNVVSFARSRSDQILVGLTTGPAGLGLFSLGRKLNETIDSFVKAPIDRVAVSAFSRIQDDPDRLQKATLKAMSLNALFSVPIFLGLAMVTQEVVPLAFGKQWSVAATVCALLAVNRLISSLFFFNYHIFISQGLPGTQTVLQSLQAIGVIAATLIGQNWGIEGVAAAICLSNLTLNISTTIVMTRKVKMRIGPILLAMSKPLIAGIIMASAVYGARLMIEPLRLQPIANLAILVVTGAATYTITIRLISRTLTQEALSLGRRLTERGSPKANPATS